MQFLITFFSKKDGIKTNKMFYLTRPLLLGDFRKSSPVPFFTLKEGAPPLPRPPLLMRGLQPVNRLFCTRKQAHALKGCSWSFYAIELRLFMRRGRPCGIGGMRMTLGA